MASDTLRDNLDEVMNNNFHGPLDEQAAIERLFNPIRITTAVFRYIHHPDVLPVIQGNRRNLLEATQRISANVLTLGNAHALHEEFDPVWYAARTDRARDWVQDRLVQVIQAFSDFSAANDEIHPAERRVFHQIGRLQDQIRYIEPVPQDPEDVDDEDYPD